LALWFQFWASAQDWPINVGGRPWNSLAAFVPAAFETMVLFAGLGVVLTWLLRSRLYPGRAAILPAPGVTDDRFVLQVQNPEPEDEAASLRQLLRACHARGFEESETS
jgi:molybdopterin-containing oxidoreductase family membrane subunit